MFTITGGEPLVREDIFDIVKYITVTRKAVCWMISNFGLMDKTDVDRFVQSGLQFLTCSIDSFGKKAVKSDIKALDLLEYAKSKGIICSTLTVVTNKNLDEVPDIIKEVNRRGLIFDMGLYQNVGGLFSPSSDDLKPGNMKELENLRRIIRKTKLKKGLVSPSWGYLKADLSEYLDMSWKCSSDRDKFLVVNNNGKLMACQEYATDVDPLALTSLQDPVWRSAKKECVDQCPGCFYGCYYQKENVSVSDALLDAWAMLRV
jgi:MoaA/NifB/PqqE/SkfB family radical SAM enzyme